MTEKMRPTTEYTNTENHAPTKVTVVQVLNNLQANSSKLDQANFKNKN